MTKVMTKEEAFILLVQTGALAWVAAHPESRILAMPAVHDAIRVAHQIPHEMTIYNAALELLEHGGLAANNRMMESKPEWLMLSNSDPNIYFI